MCFVFFLQMGFFRTSMSVLLEVSGPTLRLERRDSRRDLTAGRTTRWAGASAAAWSHSSSMTVGSSVGREERLQVEGRGVLTSSRISSLDLGALLDWLEAQPPAPSSGQRLSFSTLPLAEDLLSEFTPEKAMADVSATKQLNQHIDLAWGIGRVLLILDLRTTTDETQLCQRWIF